MSKELYISATPHETKVAIVEDDQLTEVYYERENEYTLAGSIYKGRVTRVLPGMQSAFVDLGLERDAFLYVTDFMEEQEDQEEYVVTSSGLPAGDSHPRQEFGDSRQSDDDQSQSAAEEEETTPTTAPGPESDSGKEERGGVRRWRGRRGRRRPRGEFREQKPARSESGGTSGFAPSSSAVSEPDTGDTGVPEPRNDDAIGAPPSAVLPGESISKYMTPDRRSEHEPPRGPQPAEQVARPVSSFRPSTEIGELRAEGWSGGNILPGESISKYRAGDVPVTAAAPEPRRFEDVLDPEDSDIEQPSHDVARLETQRAVVLEAETSEPVLPSFVHSEKPETAPPPAQSEDIGHQPIHAESASPAGFENRFDHEDAVTSASEPERESADALPSTMHAVLEDEEIDEEEDELGRFVAEDDAEFEEMEEETLAADAGQIGEAVRDAHLEERLRGEPLAEQEEGAEAESEEEATAELGALEESETEFEGRAEVRAPSETAAFQQRPERSPQDRDRRFQRRRGNRRLRGGGPAVSRQSHPALPTISELLKEGQEILVQIAKEPIAKKGARITSHIALPGRFLVFMPTVNHVGVSRKISSEEERQRLKRILLSEKGSAHGGFIVRTAAGGASEEDLRADIRFLINLWTEIRNRSENSKSPALIYHDLNLVERILRDQVSTNFSTVWVDNEQEYERVVRFLNRFQPSLVRRVKLYTKDTPLFEQFNIQEEINKALKSKVWLRSGGYIVINQTEALVAIDVNTGKYVGKTARLEDTIVKTNVDAIQEIVRQIRLRDLGGIIVIDFIDMDERRNRQKVMQALEEALKADRAPSKVLQFNDFGLVAITRKRVKQSLERTLGTQCSYCTGTGMVKSPATVCNEIYAEMRKMSRHLENRDVLLRVNPEVVKALKANNARWLSELEDLAHRTIIVKSDPALHQEQFDIN